MDSEYPHIAFLTYATNFADSASVIVDSGQVSKLRLVMTYLYGHAIELALKSILLKNGMSIENVKGVGHDLEDCTTQASKCPEGDYLDDKLQEVVRLLNPEYLGKHLEYHPGETFMLLPSERLMQISVANLVRSLRRSYTPARLPQEKL